MKALGCLFFLAIAVVSWGYFYRQITSRPAAQIEGPKIENFALFDHQGGFFDLSRKSYLKGIVLISHGCECPMVRKQAPYLEALKEKYAAQGIGFFYINPQDSPKEVVAEAGKFGVTIPVLLDDSQIVARGLHLTRTLEAILIDAKTRKIVYRGAISDELSFDGDRNSATNEYLANAVDDFLKGRGPAVAQTELTGGCAYSFRDLGKVTYHSIIKKILHENCLGCHSNQGIPPTKMLSYQDVQRWGSMIREVIRTNRMPPVMVDPNFGPYPKANLRADQRAALVQWVESGMPEGLPTEAPAIRPSPLPPVTLRIKTDVQFDMKEPVRVPPSGKFLSALYPIGGVLEEDTWADGFQLLTADPSQVHHVHLLILPKDFAAQQITGLSADASARTLASGKGNMIGFSSYQFLKRPVQMPADAVVLIPKESRLMLDVHHSNTGKWENFKEGVGISLAKCGKAYRQMHFGGLYDKKLRVPANTPEHRTSFNWPLLRDIQIHQVHFHMHKRGRGIKLSIRSPDGEIQPVMSVPNYRFGAQQAYPLKPPMKVPKGSEILIEAVYDNSVANPLIDNPNHEVPEGPDVDSDEMMKMSYLYTIDGEPPYFRSCKGARQAAR